MHVPELEEFDFTKIEPDSACIYVGKRREGKTVALLNNWRGLVENEYLAGAVVISKTENANMTYQQFILRDYIYTGWQPILYETIKAKMTDFRFLYDMGRIPHPGYLSIVLDDMISEKAMMYDRDLTDMFVAGRHYFLNVHITTQYPKAIPPRVRDNADYVFLFKASGPANRLKLYEDFGSGLTKDEFFCLLNRYTKNFKCLVFRNRRPEEKDKIELPGTWGHTQSAPTTKGKRKGKRRSEGREDQEKDKDERQVKKSKKEAKTAPDVVEEEDESVVIDEKGNILDPDRFKNYFWVRYPFPIPEFRMGSEEAWQKQDEEKNQEADGLLLHYTGGDEVEEIKKPGDRAIIRLQHIGAWAFIQEFLTGLQKQHQEFWARSRNAEMGGGGGSGGIGFM